MITSLRLQNFKNFRDENLRVGPFTVIVGSNASGKSNIRDALRVIHGIGRGYTVAEIIGGKYGAGGQVEWEPIRGAPREIGRSDTNVFALRLHLTLKGNCVEYLVMFRPELVGSSGFRIEDEQLWISGNNVYVLDAGKFETTLDNVAKGFEYILRGDQPILTQVRDISRDAFTERQVEPAVNALANMRFLDLVPDRMRQPSIPGLTVLGDSGENLPTVLQALCADSKKKETFAAWTRELTPMDVKDFDFREGPDGKVHLIIQEKSGREISAHSASDGTLRFLAMLAALLGPEPARLYFFEEIDNGIHPSRLHLLIDLIERQTAKGQTQVIATTHSPELLTMIGDTTFENTSVVCRLEDTENAIIRPVADLPNARKLRTDQGLGQLLAGGWMEDALAFTEENKDSGMDSE